MHRPGNRTTGQFCSHSSELRIRVYQCNPSSVNPKSRVAADPTRTETVCRVEEQVTKGVSVKSAFEVLLDRPHTVRNPDACSSAPRIPRLLHPRLDRNAARSSTLRRELRQPTKAARTSIFRSRAVSLTNPSTRKVLRAIFALCCSYWSAFQAVSSELVIPFCSNWSAFKGSVRRARFRIVSHWSAFSGRVQRARNRPHWSASLGSGHRFRLSVLVP